MSDLNGRYGSQVAHEFPRKTRNTDIPGTVKNTNLQRNGPDNDVLKTVNAEVGKRSLALGMVELGKQFHHRDGPAKTNQLPGRRNWKGEGTVSDPWDHDPESVWKGQQRLSTFRNHQSFVRSFATQVPRTVHGSIYRKWDDARVADPLAPNREEEDTIRLRACASEAGRHSGKPRKGQPSKSVVSLRAAQRAH